MIRTAPDWVGFSTGGCMVIESAKHALGIAGYAGTTLIAFAVDNVTGVVAAVVGGIFIGVSIALPRALPALKSAGAAWLEYCATRDMNKLEAWKANEAAHLAARLAEDEKMRPTLTGQMQALKAQADAQEANLVARLDEAKAEAQAAKDEARQAKEQAALNIAITQAGTKRAVRHIDANKANIDGLAAELARREALLEAEAGTKAIVAETAEVVRKIEDATVSQGNHP